MALYDQRIATIILKHLKGQLTHEEAAYLNVWLQSEENKQLFEKLTNEEILNEEVEHFSEAKNNVWNKINESIQQDKVIPIRTRTYKFKAKIVAAAAVFMLLLAGGAYFYLSSSNAVAKEVVAAQPLTLDDIRPGTTKATLTLANGKVVYLDEVANGTLLIEDGVQVIKLSDGQLLYQLTPENKLPDIAATYNTVSTPRGGQHKVLLSDGTQVWLNAASSISYPTSFNGLDQRKVTITGEAYFEVAPMIYKGKKKIPFIVNVAGKGEVEVLGTHFNVNAYPEETFINTTLLEGSVKVHTGSTSGIIKPGQQAQFGGAGKLTISNDINIDQVMAWKNGQFMFKGATLETILKDAARWYDVDVIFENGKPTADRFSGAFSRDLNLGDFFKVLQYSDVNVRMVEGRRLVISH